MPRTALLVVLVLSVPTLATYADTSTPNPAEIVDRDGEPMRGTPLVVPSASPGHASGGGLDLGAGQGPISLVDRRSGSLPVGFDPAGMVTLAPIAA